MKYDDMDKWWEQNIRPFLPDDEIEWRDLSVFERWWKLPRLRRRIENDKENTD